MKNSEELNLFGEIERCKFNFFEPREYPIEKFGKEGFWPLLVFISNKYLHPNLYLIAWDGEYRKGKELPLVKIRLFPTRVLNECKQVGTITFDPVIEPIIDPVIDYLPLLSLEYDCCPTSIFLMMNQDSDEQISLFSPFLQKFKDARNTFKLLKKYRKDPIERISKDFGFMMNEHSKYEILTDKEAMQLAKIVIDNGNQELAAFIWTWKETLNYASLYPDLEQVPMEEFADWMNKIFGIELEI